MAKFKYVGSAQPRPDGTYEFRVRAKKFAITFEVNEVFEIPDSETFVIKCIRGIKDFNTQTCAYEEIIDKEISRHSVVSDVSTREIG